MFMDTNKEGLDRIINATHLPSDIAAPKPLTAEQALERDLPIPKPASPYVKVDSRGIAKLGTLIRVTEEGEILRNFNGNWKPVIKRTGGLDFVWFQGKRLPAAKLAFYYYYGNYPTGFVKRLDRSKGFTKENLELAYNTNDHALSKMFKDEWGKSALTNWGSYTHDRLWKWNQRGGKQPSHDALGRTFESRRKAGETIPEGEQSLYFLPQSALNALEKQADKIIEDNGGFASFNILRPALR